MTSLIFGYYCAKLVIGIVALRNNLLNLIGLLNGKKNGCTKNQFIDGCEMVIVRITLYVIIGIAVFVAYGIYLEKGRREE